MADSTSIPSSVQFLSATHAGAARAAELLNAGKLVVLPTETVYGIALNLQFPEARLAARALKSHLVMSADPGSVLAAPWGPWVVHVANVEDVLRWVPRLSPIGRRLVTKALPGPVAFQIKLSPEDEATAREKLAAAAPETIVDGYLTLRCPDLTATRDVLAAAAGPVAIIGAGTTTQPGVYEARELPAGLLSDVNAPQAVLDGGATRYRRSSTLVRMEGEHISVVRSGVIDDRIIQKMADFTILFLCSGNTCRSPMAAALAAKQIADRLKIAPAELPLRHIVVTSAGLHANRGARAAAEAMNTVKNWGADLTTHLSQPATSELLRRADVIYTMTDAHREEVLELMPSAGRKTSRIDPDGDIADPIGLSAAVYQQVASRLSELLQRRLSELSI